MAKFRKLPVEIEAFQFTKEAALNEDWPDWFADAWCKEDGTNGAVWVYDDVYQIGTLEGPHSITIGDYIIQGVQGEIYPCKPDIFEATYEPVEVNDA